MGIFRKRDRPAEGALAIAASEEIAARMLGSPLSLGVKMVTSEILGGRMASRGLVTSAESFRLGVIGVFTLAALLRPDIRCLGVLFGGTAAIAAAYRGDRFGAGTMPLQEYLAAFGIQLLPEGDIGLIRAGDAAVSISGTKKHLIIVHEARSLHHLRRIGRGLVVHPVVGDDGKAAYMVDR
jgi:hypothetical protein